MSHDELSQLKHLIEDKFTELDEKSVQQRSGHHSDLKKQINDMGVSIDIRMYSLEEKIASLGTELASWKLGSKIGIAVIVAIGGLITWVLNSFGIKIGIK